MIRNGYRTTLVFNDLDVANIFAQKSLIASHLPLSTIETVNHIAVLTYDSWCEVTHDERLDSIFYPNVISSTFNQPVQFNR